jgi:serine/threonine protein kinase
MSSERPLGKDGLPSPWRLRPDIHYIRKLGEGANGSVYEARWNNDYYAVKRISVGVFLQSNPWNLKDKAAIELKIKEEINLMFRVSSTQHASNYVVTIHDSWEEDAEAEGYNESLITAKANQEGKVEEASSFYSEEVYSGPIPDGNVSPFKCFFILMDLCDTDLGSWLQQERDKIDLKLKRRQHFNSSGAADSLSQSQSNDMRKVNNYHLRRNQKTLEYEMKRIARQKEREETANPTEQLFSDNDNNPKNEFQMKMQFTYPSEKQKIWEETLGQYLFDIYGQILLCLDFLHVDCDIVHRDLHPGNILLSGMDYGHRPNRPIVKLTDLGLSKRPQKQNAAETVDDQLLLVETLERSLSLVSEDEGKDGGGPGEMSAILGCPQYRPPDRKLDYRGDTFSAALVFLKMWFADVSPVTFDNIRRTGGKFPRWIRESPLFKQLSVQHVHGRMLEPELELRFSAWEAFKHVCTEWTDLLDPRKR